MSDFPLDKATALAVARDVVQTRFADVVCAWLSGSVAAGRATATSDLDVVVLLAGPPAPRRESLMVNCRGNGIPVELFVHTAASVRHYVGSDRERRQPSMARMIADGVPLVDVPVVARDVVERCRADLERGPDPLSQNEIDARRYAVTDLLEDLRGATSDTEGAVLAATLWEAAARLLLGADRQWQGMGKGLLRALHDRDAAMGDQLGEALTAGLLEGGRNAALERAVERVLDRAGGPLFDGYQLGGETG